MADELRAVTKTYDFSLWLLPHLGTFSRDYRFSLGNRLEEGILEVLELLVQASYAAEKRALLPGANTRLNRVRYLIRLAKDPLALLADGRGCRIRRWLRARNERIETTG